MTTASLNFTGRGKIKQKQFSCFLEKGGDYQVSVSLDKTLLKAVDEDDVIVLDIKLRATHERFVLSADEKQSVYSELFKRESRPRYRLSIVDGTKIESGRLKLSSEEYFLTTGEATAKKNKKVKPIRVVKEARTPFFNPQESDELGELPWKVDVLDVGEVQVEINSRLLASFNGEYKHPILRAMIFPPMIRQIFEGLFLRVNSVEDLAGTESEKWFTWATMMLDKDLPEEQFIQENSLSEQWMLWLDELIDVFVSQRTEGVGTLLSEMEKHLDD